MGHEGLGQDPGELGPDAEKVWQREQEYWGLFCQGDPGCFALVAEDFLGWPHNADAPQDKTGISAILAKYREKPLVPILQLAGLIVVEDVAVVHLLRTIAAPDLPPASEQVPVRVIHTWLRQSGEWFLLGGMGYQPGTS